MPHYALISLSLQYVIYLSNSLRIIWVAGIQFPLKQTLTRYVNMFVSTLQ